ncbi:hypothetical protein ACJMK2_030626, partial [Sinanodonta woodiana]
MEEICHTLSGTEKEQDVIKLLCWTTANRYRPLFTDSFCPRGGFNNDQPQFGPGCRYMCHCVGDGQCDNVTGVCPGGCDAGWMGPGCQYGDIAYQKQVKQLLSGKFIDGSMATDGVIESCIGPTTRMEVDLKDTYRISGLVITPIMGVSLQDFEVTVRNYSLDPHSDFAQICFQQNTTEQLNTKIDVLCITEVVGRYLLIRTLDNATTITLCDVRVYGGRSLAYRRNASQSSTSWTDYGYGVASRALDGDVSTNFVSSSCTHTLEETSTWWRVNLEIVYDIMRIVLYNRQDCCAERLSGFSVSFATNNNFSLVFQYPEKTPMAMTEITTLSDDLALAVEISLRNRTSPTALTLCEVFVFGDCQNNVCGWTCDTYCYCDGPIAKENKIQATCPGKCITGWWGRSCNNACDTNCIGNTCNQRDGHCMGCARGKWGHLCDNNCTNCLDNTRCGIYDGICTIGCASGLYGINCSEPCGHCAGDGSCNRSTGACIHGLQREETSIKIGVLLGGALGAAGLLIMIIIVAIIVWRRRNGSFRAKHYHSKQSDPNIPESQLFSNIYENTGAFKPEETKSVMKPERKRSFSKIETDIDGNVSSIQLDVAGETIDQQSSRSDDADVKISVESINKESLGNMDEGDQQNIYYNTGINDKRSGKKIAVQDLSEYINSGIHRSNCIEDEFKTLLSGPQHEMSIALKLTNKQKNRYKGMYAYDKNRVILETLPDDPDTDYINASFINGYKKDKAYIAAQGTIAANVNDYWRMIWQYDIQQIVMLTGLIEQGKSDSTKQKTVHQFHFTSWPDRGVPDTAYSLVQFWNKVRHSDCTHHSPILVHCSAGIGRTGTYIALDYSFDEGREEGYVNIFECVNNLRQQRVGLVQTAEQYVYLHEVILEAFQDTANDMSIDDLKLHYAQMRRNPGMTQAKLLTEFEKLQEDLRIYFERDRMRVTKDESSGQKDEFMDGKLPENKTKNRFKNILPSKRYRPFLSSFVPGRNDYINAVCLPTRKNGRGLIVTQMPLPDTVIDFWRLVYDYEVQSIVMLNDANMPEEEVGVYWPENGETSGHGPFVVTITSNVQKDSHAESMLHVSKHGEERTLSLKQFACSVWRLNDAVPKSIDGFVNLIEDVEDWKRQSGERPILVHCMNGAERSGLFCVLWCALEKLWSDREVAIRSIVRQMRIRRQHIIPNF